MEGNKDAQVINMIGALWKRANIDLNPLTNKESVLAYVGSGFEALDAFGSGSNIKGYANIFGQTKKLLSEKYLYYQGEEFKDNPEDYESVGGYNNLDINDYSLKSYLTAI